MSENKFRLAMCQIRTETDRKATMEKAERMVREAAEKGADIVQLPEMFNCPYAKEYFKTFAALGHEDTVKEMSRWAAENRIILVVFDTEFGPMGAAVCFDLRFPELFRAMAERGARCVFLPAQFNLVTGPKHWELSLRMRAVDYHVFVAGCAAARYEGFSYECWGHSTVADPMGAVLCTCDEKEQILYADIDLEQTDTAKAQLPTGSVLRRDLYPVAK